MSVILDHTSPKLNVHSNIPLFPHQQALVAQMIKLEKQPRRETSIYVLKDPPGSGKSFPLLAMMLYEKRQFQRTQNLLVIPMNIHQQWLDYIKNFSEELHVKSLMYYGDVNALFYDARALFMYDIIITTATFYPMVTDTVRQIGAWFNRVILDEIDSIAFFTETAVPAQIVWLVSASAEMTKSGIYREFAKRNSITCDPLFIKRSINLPPPRLEYHECYNEYVELLQKGVLQNLKPLYGLDFTSYKFEYLRNEHIVNAKQLLSAVFRDNCLALHGTIEGIKSLEVGAKFQQYLVDSYQQKLQKKAELEEQIKNIITILDRRKCPMCCDNYAEKGDRVKTECCATLLCRECITKWVSTTSNCPVCYKKLTINNLVVDTEPVSPVPPRKEINDKMEEFEEILKKEIQRENYRVLIFSDFTGTFLKIQKVLEKYKSERSLAFSEIEGNQIKIDHNLRAYKEGRKPVLLVNSQSFGAGMNLEETTAVIILHKTEREAQVVGRAQRLGRKDILHVHHIVYKNET